MAFTKKQVRVLQCWMVLAALITLFPPHEVERRAEMKGSDGVFIVSRPWFHHDFVLSGGAHPSEYEFHPVHYIPKGINGLALLCEMGFITFVSGVFFTAFRAKE